MIFEKSKLVLSSVLAALVLVMVVGCGDDEPAGPVDPPPGNTVTDIDGNVYQTVVIGTQVWMAENLSVTHYRNGDAIAEVADYVAWAGLSTGAYCAYANNASNVSTYGRLYNWFAVGDTRNIAPAGWHVPTDAEFKQMELELGMTQAQVDSTGFRGEDEGDKLKAIGTTYWVAPNSGATDEVGFTALPGGSRYGYDGSFFLLQYRTYYWSSTEDDVEKAWSRGLRHDDPGLFRGNEPKTSGMAVRCVKD